MKTGKLYWKCKQRHLDGSVEREKEKHSHTQREREGEHYETVSITQWIYQGWRLNMGLKVASEPRGEFAKSELNYLY